MILPMKSSFTVAVFWEASDGFHLWAQNFDRKLADIFALQDEIGLLIADQIRENFGHFELQEHLVEPPTTSIEAYNWYLKGGCRTSMRKGLT